jgi:hypothetical protein
MIFNYLDDFSCLKKARVPLYPKDTITVFQVEIKMIFRKTYMKRFKYNFCSSFTFNIRSEYFHSHSKLSVNANQESGTSSQE